MGANGKWILRWWLMFWQFIFFEVRLSWGIVHSRGFGFGVLLKVSLSTNLSVGSKKQRWFHYFIGLFVHKKVYNDAWQVS